MVRRCPLAVALRFTWEVWALHIGPLESVECSNERPNTNLEPLAAPGTHALLLSPPRLGGRDPPFGGDGKDRLLLPAGKLPRPWRTPCGDGSPRAAPCELGSSGWPPSAPPLPEVTGESRLHGTVLPQPGDPPIADAAARVAAALEALPAAISLLVNPGPLCLGERKRFPTAISTAAPIRA